MPRIMIADDNTNIQKMVVLAFEERGIDVVAVGNGEAAVRRLADANPDLILADVFMPVRNGYEVCEYVKKDSRFSHVPVILLVGAFDPLDEKEARRVGADGVLKKPFVPPDPLIAMVMSALEKNPKVAAELAKAREVPAEPPPPPVPAMEIPAKTEPKPLPEFPEPTPEEAAAIYGFGKGVRSLDDAEVAAGKEPKAPVMDPEEEAGEDFDGAATTNDWRRKSGLDIQIPENIASEPSFSYGRDNSPTIFPSERDVPPRRIHVPDEVIEQQAVAREAAPINSGAQDPGSSPADDFFHAAARPQPEPIAVQRHIDEPLAKQEAEPEFAPLPRTRSWMDMMAPLPTETSATTETADTNASHAANEAAQSQASSAAPHRQKEAASPASGIPEPQSEAIFFEEQQPKRKSWFTDAVEAVRDAVHSVVQESGHEENHVKVSDAIQEDIHEPAHEPAPETVSSATLTSSHELDSEPAETTPSRRDPGLIEPPAAHVTAEPLLVRDEPSAPSGYGKREESTAPAYSFIPAAAEEHVAEEISSNGGHALFAPPEETAPRDSRTADYGERIPTAPPPNREALAEIPFLTPPPPPADSGKLDQDTVDAVVARVLEKLEPQLHDLLSRGVLKPLIEGMLQGELVKKDK